MNAPFFTVAIPTYNRLELLLRVLDSLGSQQSAPPFEVIVIDDGSTDATHPTLIEESARSRWSFPLEIVTQKNSGPGEARNKGAARAHGDYVLFIGDDTVPEPHFLAEHARVHRESGLDPLVACLGYTGWPLQSRVTPFMDHINDFGLQFGYKLIKDGEVVPFNFFYTSNISIARTTLGPRPFDTTFPSAAWEDIELAFRLDRAGLKIRYNAKAVTRHHHDMTVASFAKRQYVVGKSGAIFFSKHPELGHFLGVFELKEKGLADEATLRKLDRRARLGERFRLFARSGVFDTLMRQHYLRGMRDGMREYGVEMP